MYLVFLAIPDLILNIYLLGMYASYANQKYNPAFSSGNLILNESHPPAEFASFEGAFVVACPTANLYLNAVVSYEVFTLLKSNHQIRRYSPPKLQKVMMQATSVYLFAILVFFTHYFICRAVSKGKIYVWTNTIWSLVVTYLIPIGFVCCVCAVIWYRGYISSATGNLRQCVWYFTRIIVVFFVVWLPGMLLLVIGTPTFNGELINIVLLFCAIQPILSTCMAMTKADVRNYCLDLITLSYIWKNKEKKTKEQQTLQTVPPTTSPPYTRSPSPNMSDVDEEIGDNDDVIDDVSDGDDEEI